MNGNSANNVSQRK